MPHAIVVTQTGGPEVLKWGPIDLPAPGSGEVRLRHTAVGLNFIDVYQRTGLYPMPLPFTPGLEAAGIIEELGPDVDGLNIGDRVAYPAGPPGAYASHRNMPAGRLIHLPDNISDQTAAAVMLKGCTAEYLIRRTHAVQSGDWVLFHAAAGGVGHIACQWLKALGANVIGTAGTPEKCELAAANGCDHTILYSEESVPKRVRDITNGKGVAVVYDSVGKATFADSIDCLSPRGTMVSFGNATGPVDPVPPALLAQKGSLYLTRPSLMHYYADPGEFQAGCRAVIDAVTSGKINVQINQTFPLSDVAQAHQALETRATTGASVLLLE